MSEIWLVCKTDKYIDLTKNRAYKVVKFEESDFVRVIDNSGKDYLYPRHIFHEQANDN